MTQANKPRNPTERRSGEEMILHIPLNTIQLGDQVVRDDPDDDSIIELAADINRRGLLQPIGVAPRGAGIFELLWGLRRFLAHRRLNRSTILARVLDIAPDQVKSTALVENLQRQQMTLREECNAVAHLHHKTELSPDQIAAVLSKSRAWVLCRLSLPALPDDLKEPVLDGSLAIGSAEALALLDDAGARAFILQQIASNHLSISQVRALVKTYQDTPEIQAAVQAGLDTYNTPVANQPLLMACAACGTTQKCEDLILVRVCRTGCAQPNTAPNGDHDAH